MELVNSSFKEELRDEQDERECSNIYVVPGQGDNPVGALASLYASGPPVRQSIAEVLDVIEAALREHQDGLDPSLVRNVLLGNAAADPILVGVPQLCAFTTAICVHQCSNARVSAPR